MTIAVTMILILSEVRLYLFSTAYCSKYPLNSYISLPRKELSLGEKGTVLFFGIVYTPLNNLFRLNIKRIIMESRSS